MEVHTHTHSSVPDSHRGKKKFSHYLWEFLMLFLAVFCGFLAEYQLEHIFEHNREDQYMKSMVEDLATDTVELQRAIHKCDSVNRYSDSVLIFLASYKITNEIPKHFAYLIGVAGQNQTLINTDRTSTQLKNSGSMRLIRKKDVSDAILNYWNQIEITNISLERYRKYRDAGRELSFKLWVIPEVYSRSLSRTPNSTQPLRVIDTDHRKWDELANLITISGVISRQAHLNNMKKQAMLATDLIALIKKEYHLK